MRAYYSTHSLLFGQAYVVRDRRGGYSSLVSRVIRRLFRQLSLRSKFGEGQRLRLWGVAFPSGDSSCAKYKNPLCPAPKLSCRSCNEADEADLYKSRRNGNPWRCSQIPQTRQVFGFNELGNECLLSYLYTSPDVHTFTETASDGIKVWAKRARMQISYVGAEIRVPKFVTWGL